MSAGLSDAGALGGSISTAGADPGSVGNCNSSEAVEWAVPGGTPSDSIESIVPGRVSPRAVLDRDSLDTSWILDRSADTAEINGACRPLDEEPLAEDRVCGVLWRVTDLPRPRPSCSGSSAGCGTTACDGSADIGGPRGVRGDICVPVSTVSAGTGTAAIESLEEGARNDELA